MKNFAKISTLLIAALLLAVPAQATTYGGITDTTSTTLSAAITSLATQQFCVASATGISVTSVSTAGTYLVVDSEFVQVTTAGSSTTCFNVKRGQLGSVPTTHLNAATVWVGNVATGTGDNSRPFSGGAIVNIVPKGPCTASLQYALPVLVQGIGGAAYAEAGLTFNCINGMWTRTSAYNQLVVTSAAQTASATATAAGDAFDVTGGAGSAQTATTGTGGAGGAIVEVAGVGGAGGSSSGTGGAGGAIAYTAGAGGGTVTGGAGGSATLKAGAGGNGSTAGGSGGDTVLQAGAAGTGGTGTAGKVKIKDAADATKVVAFDPSGATAATTTTFATSQTGNVTITFPNITGGLAPVIDCGQQSGGTSTCAGTATGKTGLIFMGKSTLASNAQVVTFSTAFTSTTTYSCVANDVTTRANPVQMVQTSSSTATITNTTGASDVINWVCIGY